MHRRTAYLTVGAAGLLATGWTCILAMAKLSAGAMSALDLGIYTQVAWLTAHGHWFGLTIHPHLYLGDHMELLFAVAAIPFRFGAGPLALVGLQCLAVVGASFALFGFARRYVSTALACAAAILFLLNPFTLNALAFEFHAVLFGLPFAFLAATAYTEKKLGTFWLWSGILLLAREDLALLLAGFALLAFLDKRKRAWWLWPGLVAIVWYIGTSTLAGVINGEGYKFVSYFQPGGLDGGNVSSGLLGILQLGNFLVLIALLLSVLLLPLLAWRWLVLIMLPLIGIGLAGIRSGDLILQTHYAAFFLPGLFCGAVVGWKKLWERPPAWLNSLGNHGLPFAFLLVGVVSLYSLFTFGPTIGAARAWQNISAAERYKAKEAERIVWERTPRNASVVAGYSMLPYFATRPQVYAAHYAFLGKRQFSEQPYPLPEKLDTVVLDAEDFVTFQLQYADGKRRADYESGAARFQTLLITHGLRLSAVFDTLMHFTRDPDAADILPILVTRTSRASLTGAEFALQSAMPTVTVDPITSLAKLQLIGQVGNPALPNIQARLHWLDAQGKKLETRLLPLGYGLVPTTSWLPDEVVTTTFMLLAPKNATRAVVEAIAPRGHLQLNGWRAPVQVLDAETRVVSQRLLLPLE